MTPELQRATTDFACYCHLALRAERWGLPMAAQAFRERAREAARDLVQLHQQQQQQFTDLNFLPFPVQPWPPPPPNAA
jgi:hypothetical protein